MRQVPRWAFAVVALLAFILAVALWREHGARKTAETNVPFESARIIDATFDKAVSLKVATLSGQVRSSASDAVLFGRIVNTQSRTFPYSVDYFVDLRRFGKSDMRWNAATKTMVVTVPDVMPAVPNVDEARGTMEAPKGLIVPRGSMQRLQQQISGRATGVVSKTANDPAWIAKARESGRDAMAQLVRAPLAAAGVGDVKVAVRYASEGTGRSAELWDESTPLDIIMARPE
ncbi:hypothetical protein SPAN111604_05965 [Sphingomonas antarctica]|uniref:hypothetical protein n=1 Tax=Sphingomonas antarctica TaxID=2040274 RepID=UPI0039E9A203